MKYTYFIALVLVPIACMSQDVNPFAPDQSAPPLRSGMKLVFSEEFNYTGKPDTTIWSYETGYVRNNELQWYQSDNAICKEGRLLIEGRKANFPNPDYVAGSNNWKTNRDTVRYTSSSIKTMNKKAWQFGRFEVRARIDTALGSWPAIWTLGVEQGWPWCGEIDMMEFYLSDSVPSILANVAWGTNKRWVAKWDMTKTPVAEFIELDIDWPRKYHVWRMDWTKDSINLYLDDKLLNSTLVSEAVNPDGSNPFLQPHYMLLNLALGSNGGDPSKSKFPITYEVDYFRVYQ